MKKFLKKIFNNIGNNEGEVVDVRFKRNNDLIVEKLVEYIPAMLMTNLSTMLMVSLDGIVAGNFIGQDALSSVNIFYPITLILSILVVLLSQGIATTLSLHMGQHDYDNLLHIKSSMKFLMIVAIILLGIIQVPIVNIIVASYNLTPEMHDMTMKYAIGLMILNPISIISTVGVYQLQIVGKMKIILFVAVAEFVLNFAFDLLFVCVLGLGIAGDGYGTAVAGIIRAIITLVYLCKKTDIYESKKAKIRIEDIKEILSLGMPEATYYSVMAFKNYVLMKIILMAFGTVGGSIKGVCTFCYNISSIIVMGITSSMRPLIGFFEGAKDQYSLKNVMNVGLRLLIVSASVVMLIIEVFPNTFYMLHGVGNASDDALLSLRLYASCFVFMGVDSALRLYFTNRKDTKFTSGVTLASYVLMPGFAFLFYKLISPPMLWLSNLIVELIIFTLYVFRYRYFAKKDMAYELGVDYDEVDNIENAEKHFNNSVNKKVLYLSVKPSDAIDASRYIRQYAMDHGFSDRIAYRISLCMEEMVNYAVVAHNKKDISIQIIVRFNGDEGVFIMLDDGECIELNKDKNLEELTIDNYTLIKKIVKSYDYQYILDMNHTILNI